MHTDPPTAAAHNLLTRTGRTWRRALWVLAAAGLLLPWWLYLPHFVQGGLPAVHGFWRAATANPVATAITLDVYLAGASFALWVLHERRVRRPWLYVLGCFAVGLAAVLPLYLVQRERGDDLSR